MKRILILATLSMASVFGGQAKEVLNEVDPVILFEKRYDIGTRNVTEKNWIDAARHLEAALSALGTTEHRKKQVAQILLKKALEESRKQRALFTAQELLRLKQWKEAEEAFLTAKNDLGETLEIKQGLDAIRIGRDEERLADPAIRVQLQREKEFLLALAEGQRLHTTRETEKAYLFARQARALRPDDTRAQELIQDIERVLNAGGKPLAPAETKTKTKQPEF
jgi:hypothetical protein